MTDKIDLSKKTSYLFDCNFFDDEFFILWWTGLSYSKRI